MPTSTDVTVVNPFYTSAINRTHACNCIKDSVVQRLTIPPNDSSNLIVQASTSIDTSTSTVPSSKSFSEGSLNKVKQKRMTKMFPLLQIAPGTVVNQRGIAHEFPGLMKNLQTFNNAMQQNSHQPFFNAQKVDQRKPNLMPQISTMPVISADSYTFVNQAPCSSKPKETKHAPISLPLLNIPKNTKIDSAEPNEQFSFIPFKPFVPKLFKPGRVSKHRNAQTSLPLLQCEYQNKRQTFPLFSVNSTDRTANPQSLVNTSSQSDTVSTVSVCSSVPSIADQGHHKRSRKPRNDKVFPNMDTTCDDASGPPLPHNISDKAVQVNSSLTDTSIPRSLPILIQHHSLEMSRIEMKKAQKSVQLQDTAKGDVCAVNYNYQTSTISTSVSEPVTATVDTIRTATSVIPLTNPRIETVTDHTATTEAFIDTRIATTTEVFTDNTKTSCSALFPDPRTTTSRTTVNAVSTTVNAISTTATAAGTRTIAAVCLNDTSVGDKQVFLDVVDIEGGSNDSSEADDNIPSSQEDMNLFLSHMDHEGDTSVVKKHKQNTPPNISGMDTYYP